MEINNLYSIISSVIMAGSTILLVIFAYKSVKIYKVSALSSIYQKIHEEYSSNEMNEAVKHLYDFRREYQNQFNQNRYKFAITYKTIYHDKTPQWQLRRKVTHFYCHIDNLLAKGLIDKKFVFNSFSLKDLEIIKILEPIESVIWMSTGERNSDKEWGPLRLYESAVKWFDYPKHKKLKYTIPSDEDLFSKIYENKD